MSSSKHEALRELSRRIEQIESGRRRHGGSANAAVEFAALDSLLPVGGFGHGVLMEFLSVADGGGAWTLGIVMAVRACRGRKALVVVDSDGQLYLPGAVRLGLELDRCIVVRPGNRRDAYQAIVQSLRCTAVGAVLGWQGRLSMRQLRCLQLAAESTGGSAILLRPAAESRVPSCAAVRLVVSPVAADSPVRSVVPGGEFVRARRFSAGSSASVSGRSLLRYVRVDVLRCRGRASGQSLVLEVDDETGDVRASAAVAATTVAARSARASG